MGGQAAVGGEAEADDRLGRQGGRPRTGGTPQQLSPPRRRASLHPPPLFFPLYLNPLPPPSPPSSLPWLPATAGPASSRQWRFRCRLPPPAAVLNRPHEAERRASRRAPCCARGDAAARRHCGLAGRRRWPRVRWPARAPLPVATRAIGGSVGGGGGGLGPAIRWGRTGIRGGRVGAPELCLAQQRPPACPAPLTSPPFPLLGWALPVGRPFAGFFVVESFLTALSLSVVPSL